MIRTLLRVLSWPYQFARAVGATAKNTVSRLHKSETFDVIVRVLAIVGVLGALYFGVRNLPRDAVDPAVSPAATGFVLGPSSTSASGRESSSSALSTPAPPSDPTGTCLDATRTETPCDAFHSYEVYSSAPCDIDRLRSYVGAVLDVDVLNSALETSTEVVHETSACVVRTPEANGAFGSARDILAGASGDAWRECIDLLDRQVPCSLPHRSEVVYVANGGAAELGCAEKAARYLEAPLNNFVGRITAVQGSVDGQLACLVTVLGDNVLTASLRRIKTSALPIEAAQ